MIKHANYKYKKYFSGKTSSKVTLCGWPLAGQKDTTHHSHWLFPLPERFGSPLIRKFHFNMPLTQTLCRNLNEIRQVQWQTSCICFYLHVLFTSAQNCLWIPVICNALTFVSHVKSPWNEIFVESCHIFPFGFLLFWHTDHTSPPPPLPRHLLP